MAPPRRVRDFIVHDIRERPGTRNVVEADAIAPQILCDSTGAYWDGRSVRDRRGQQQTVSGPRRKQLLLMAIEGVFGAGVQNAIVDVTRYDHIRDNLITWPIEDVIKREGLYVLVLKTTVMADRLSPEQEMYEASTKDQGPTTGPRPTSWSGVVSRNASQAAFVYTFQFGQRQVWKIGHTTDVACRLSEVNRHVPHEVLGERWREYAVEPFQSESDAYDVEQRLLRALRTAGSIGERVCCTEQQIESAWAAILGRNVTRLQK